jgi:hypothetical protein
MQQQRLPASRDVTSAATWSCNTHLEHSAAQHSMSRSSTGCEALGLGSAPAEHGEQHACQSVNSRVGQQA